MTELLKIQAKGSDLVHTSRFDAPGTLTVRKTSCGRRVENRVAPQGSAINCPKCRNTWENYQKFNHAEKAVAK